VDTAALITGQATAEAPWLVVASFINPHDICYMALQEHAGQGSPEGQQVAEDELGGRGQVMPPTPFAAGRRP
jgi:hypothetical protein